MGQKKTKKSFRRTEENLGKAQKQPLDKKEKLLNKTE